MIMAYETGGWIANLFITAASIDFVLSVLFLYAVYKELPLMVYLFGWLFVIYILLDVIKIISINVNRASDYQKKDYPEKDKGLFSFNIYLLLTIMLRSYFTIIVCSFVALME